MTRIATALVGASLLAGLVAGCSSSPEPQDVTVGLVDYAFEGLPDELAAGSTLSVDNQSDDELHELVAIRLPDAEERDAEELVQLPQEELGPLMGGVETVLLQGPAATRSSSPRATAPSPKPAVTWSSAPFRPAPPRRSTSRLPPSPRAAHRRAWTVAHRTSSTACGGS